jgi:CubicO group peptidase (beta-lactamase class C family)
VHPSRGSAHQLPVTASTAFPVASVTKSFTILSLGSWVEAGKLEWDKPVRSYLPDFRMHDPAATEHARAVRISASM